MGLDIVEFVLGVEEAFGVRIPNDIAASITTPRLLIDYLHGQLPPSRETHCLSQRGFYHLRGVLAERLNLSKAELRPCTELMAVLPAQNPQSIWREVGDVLGDPHWPRARGDGWLARLFLHERPRTLGEASRYVATFSPRAIKPASLGWSWAEVKVVIDGQMRYYFAITKYSLNDRFVEDLRLS